MLQYKLLLLSKPLLDSGCVHLNDAFPMLAQYYDDAAGILRSIILSAIAPHRLSMPTMPMPAFSITPEQVRPRLCPRLDRPHCMTPRICRALTSRRLRASIT